MRIPVSALLSPMALVLVWMSGVSLVCAESRVYTDLKGRKIKADVVGASGDHVYFRLNGKRFKVRLDQLIESDRVWIRQMADKARAENAQRLAVSVAEAVPQNIDSGGTSAFHPRSRDEIREAIDRIMKARVVPTDGMEINEQETRRLNAYRYLSGAPHDVGLNHLFSDVAKAGAGLCEKIGRLEHTPENPGMPEREFKKAYEGTSRSNLHMGRGTAGSVHSYMDDSDSSNIAALGHRRWCLNPSMQHVGFGEAGRFAAMYVFDRTRKRVPDFDFIQYPAAGHMPIDYFGRRHAWSVIVNPKKFKNLESVTRESISVFKLAPGADPADAAAERESVALDYFNINRAGYGVPLCLIFRPETEVRVGDRFWIEINQIKKRSGKRVSLRYLVDFFNL